MESASEQLPSPEQLSSSLSLLTRHVDLFIQAWKPGVPPALSDFLPPDGDFRKTVLVELIKYDLESRWSGGIDPLFLEDYTALFPELRNPEMPLDLIYEEYHVRTNAGLEVEAEEYLRRFPVQADAIKRLLQSGDSTQSASFVDQRHQETLKKLSAGEEFEDFELIRKLGEGAFAKVFLAQQRSMQRLVALKISADRGLEAMTLSQFNHDYIVRVYDERTVPDAGVRLLYMEYVSGGTLQDVVKTIKKTEPAERCGNILFATVDDQLQKRGESRHARSPWRRQLENSAWIDTVCWLGSCIADALSHSHAQKVLHRDIKPANVLLTGEGVPKLADFNISYCSKLDGVSPATFFGGSIGYMPPEQLEACSPAHDRQPDAIDIHADIFSLGVVLYELIFGHRPYNDAASSADWTNRLDEMIAARNQKKYSYPDDTPVPEILRATIDKCLSPAPQHRWQSASQLKKRLELLSNPKVRHYLFPSHDDFQQWIFPYARIIMFVGMLMPSIFAATFNFFYNEAKIIQPMSETMGENAAAINQHFLFVQSIINLIAFPLGIYFNDSFIRKSLAAVRNSCRQNQPTDWTSIINVGFRCAIFTLVVWSVAGLAYPISMSTQAVETSLDLYAHFFFSLLLCGLFSVAFAYFNLTAFAMLVLVPKAIQLGASEDGLGSTMLSLSKRSWLFLLTSAVVPMLASVALAISNDQTPWILGIISLGGMLSFMLCLRYINHIQTATRRLESAFHRYATAGFEHRI